MSWDTLIVAIVAPVLLLVLTEFFNYLKERRGRQDKKDEAHEEIKKSLADNCEEIKAMISSDHKELEMQLTQLKTTDVSVLRYNLIELEHSRSRLGCKDAEDCILWNSLLQQYHKVCNETGIVNGVIDEAETRWKALPVKNINANEWK